jgi:dihydropteroate synthase
MTVALFQPIRTKIMGVLNVTPDSFSDGGKFLDSGQAWAHLESLVHAGADVIDIGAESTRPGAAPVSSEDEWSRLKPILERFYRSGLKVQTSLDSRKPDLMLKAADLGVNFINDVEGARHRDTLKRLSKFSGLSYICMHMQGEPQTMQKSPLSGVDGLLIIDKFFADKKQMLAECGFEEQRIYMDPGFGFGKTDELNAKILAASAGWVKNGFKLVVGVSRKSFFGRTLGIMNAVERDATSKMSELSAALVGVAMIRTHNVSLLKTLFNLVDDGAGNSRTI